MMNDPPLSVILVTGFLGSGKTTLLKAWAADYPELRMMFLVNELAGSGVDAMRMKAAGAASHAVAGGSIFCECKAADFLRMLNDDVMPAHQRQPLDALIIETSGIADPTAIGTLIEKAGWGKALQVRSILTVIAPGKFLKLAGRLPVMSAQLEAADTVVINKTDTATEEELDACETALSELAPGAKVIRARFGRGISLRELTRSIPLPSAALGKCSALAFASSSFRPRPFADRQSLEQALNQLSGKLHRVKGTLRAGNETFEVDMTPDTRSLQPVEVTDSPLEMVVIGDKTDTSLIEETAAGLRNRSALLACDVFREELESMADAPTFTNTVWLPMGLHDRPAELRERIQTEINNLEAEGNVDEIILLYGLCGGGVQGITSQRCPLILPRAHDCIALLLGSNRRHQQVQKKHPGTYFYAPGWIRERRVPGPDREAWIRSEYADRYIGEMIDELVEADAEAFAPYDKALFIRTPAAKKEESYCRDCAAHLGWDFEVAEADPGWLRDCVNGPHTPDRFVILEPGKQLEPSADDEVFRVVNPQ